MITGWELCHRIYWLEDFERECSRGSAYDMENEDSWLNAKLLSWLIQQVWASPLVGLTVHVQCTGALSHTSWLW